jgi:RND family efflux transporter MFP subunit
MDLHFPRLTRPLILCLLAALAGCGQAGEEDDREAPQAPAVEALPARRGALPLEERLSGVVKADNQIAVRAEIEAPIVEVLARNGEAVQRGQPLVRLEDDTLRDQLRQMEASVRLAEGSAQEARARVAEVEAQVSRTRVLAREQLVSPMDLETQEAQLAAARASARQADARVEQARATVQERRSALSRTVIRAPVAGHVGQRNAEVGMLAGPDDVLFLLGDLGDLVVEVPLTEEMLGHIRPGQPVRIASPALGGDTVAATLTRISPFLEEGSFSTVGEIDVHGTPGGNRLRPGMFVTVDVLYGESEQATLVPASALWEDPRTGVQGVFVVDSAGLKEGAGAKVPEAARGVAFRRVEVLAEGRAMAGVRGVEPGQWVVVVGQQLLAGLAGEEDATARVRPTTWERVLQLQGLQREDLLQSFLDKQQEWARTRGAEPPSSEEFLGGEPPPAREGG